VNLSLLNQMSEERAANPQNADDSEPPVFQRLWSQDCAAHPDQGSDSDDETEAEWEGGILRRDGPKCFYNCVSKRKGTVKFKVGDNVLLLAPGKSVPYVAKIDELFEDGSANHSKMASVRWYYRESDCDSKVLAERNKKVLPERNSEDSAERPAGNENSSTSANKKRGGKEVFASDFVDSNPVDTFLKVRAEAPSCVGAGNRDRKSTKGWRLRTCRKGQSGPHCPSSWAALVRVLSVGPADAAAARAVTRSGSRITVPSKNSRRVAAVTQASAGMLAVAIKVNG
jgi:hypothetical protein